VIGAAPLLDFSETFMSNLVPVLAKLLPERVGLPNHFGVADREKTGVRREALCTQVRHVPDGDLPEPAFLIGLHVWHRILNPVL
jgi:hypothetical protein